MPRVTLQTIADRVGVSRMTVSNAFSRPDQLSAELRARILAAATELGYAGPDPAARALARGTSGTIGVLLTDSLVHAFSDEVAAAFMAAVAAELGPTGLALTLLTTSTRDDLVPARDLPMDGALVYSCETDSASLDWLRRRKVPLVFVDQEHQSGTPSVNIDDRGGARAAADHVVGLGHRRVGIVTTTVDGDPGLVADPRRTTTGHVQRQRMLGWLDGLHAAGIDPVVCQDRFTADDRGELGGRTVLAADPSITAILCFSDVIAAGVCSAAADLGRRLPADLSVVGFDDNPMAKRHRPALTTVRQDVVAKGRASAGMLVDVIDASRAGTTVRAKHVVLPTELVVRASTAAPAATP